jgi:hypothetical protein
MVIPPRYQIINPAVVLHEVYKKLRESEERRPPY